MELLLVRDSDEYDRLYGRSGWQWPVVRWWYQGDVLLGNTVQRQQVLRVHAFVQHEDLV
jgi:hypothetical protein